MDLKRRLQQMSKQSLHLLIMNIGLRKKYQQVLILKYIDELSNYEIGLRMGYTPETVANMLNKARKQFNHIIECEKEILPENIKPYILLLEDSD